MRKSKRGIALLCILALSAQLAGCGGESGDTQGNTTVTPTPVAASENTPTEAPTPEAEPDKEQVTDFDALVNDAWKESVKEKAEEGAYYFYGTSTEKEEQIEERVVDILEHTDLSTLDPESGLYKAIFIYRQLTDSDWQENEADAGIKKMLDQYDKVRDLKGLYTLFGDQFYGYYNPGMGRTVYTEEGNNANHVTPYSLCGKEKLTEEQCAVLADYLSGLGFSEERAKEIVSNADEMNTMIVDYLYSEEVKNRYQYYNKEMYAEAGVEYPVWDILEAQNALGRAQYCHAPNGYLDFLKDYYRPENALKIRDEAILTMAYSLSRYSAAEKREKIAAVFPDYEYHGVYDQISYWIVMRAGDVITEEYNARYISDADMENAKKIMDDVVKGMCDVIMNAEWLTPRGRELARRKILHFTPTVGANGLTNDLSGLILTEDPLENMRALILSDLDFRDEQLFVKTEFEDRKFFGYNPLLKNAAYDRELNSIIIGCGLLDDGYAEGGISYEEELGKLGCVVAHELSHAYDPANIDYDYEGYYEPWMEEDEQTAYAEKVKCVAEFFDGMEVGDGYTLNGWLVCQEAFADLLSMKCCLKMLEGMEDPDYDTFFKTFARENACYYTSRDMSYITEEGHLTLKEKVNYVPAQFEEFYETYDVDPDSPYFVPEESRLDPF